MLTLSMKKSFCNKERQKRRASRGSRGSVGRVGEAAPWAPSSMQGMLRAPSRYQCPLSHAHTCTQMGNGGFMPVQTIT